MEKYNILIYIFDYSTNPYILNHLILYCLYTKNPLTLQEKIVL